ncbi:ead/Ea22-like family protein [Enterobacter hormaechei]|uniref:ead/Ea22-like family protein n=1 Tax=Enterobacter hormaechei TaxID=158836 RepID=UPI0032DAC113
MSNIDKRALREAAERVGADEWRAFIDTKSKTYSVHTPGDNRCGDVVKWAGFDGQQRAAAKAKFIAAANPATVLALLDELEAAEKRIAELEARTVTLPENITSANAPEVFEISSEAERLGLRGTYASYAVGWNARGIADKEALREAGVKVAAAGKGE